jgi:long-chain acyl-CoA synthetase
MPGETILDVFAAQTSALASRPALRRRQGAGWQSLSWRDYAVAVRRTAAGLLALGVRPGDRVALLAANRPEWLFADLGILSIGAVSVPVYPSSIAAQVAHVIGHSGARCAIVEDGAQLDKVSQVRSSCPELEQLVTMTGGAGAVSWDELWARGDELLRDEPRRFAEARATVSPAGLATIVYTSGTTGPPKGAMLSHHNIVFEADQIARQVGFAPGEETLSFLPLSHVAERLQGEMVAIRLGFTVSFAQSLETVRDDLPLARPTILTAVPRVWEKIYEAMQAQLAGAPARRRAIFAWALAAGLRRFRATTRRETLGPRQRLLAWLADQVVGRAVRRRLGLDRARYLVSGAAPLAPALSEFFGALGMPILEAYGQTECSGVSHGTVPTLGIRPGSVGTKLPDIEVRLADDGEILLRGDNVFLGYYRDDAATRDAIDADGWLRTGDVGVVDADGYLRITDRKKDIIVTAGGKNVAPQEIENRLRAHPGISQAVVLGDRRKHLVALVTLDRQAARRALGRDAAPPLTRDAGVVALVQAAVDAVNRDLSSYEQVKRFALLEGDFSIDSGELTPTLKVRRRVIEERYRPLVDGLYADTPTRAYP